MLVAFYGLFLLYRAFKLLRAWRRTTAILRRDYSTRIPGRAAALIAKCQTAIGVSRVRVVCSASVPVPITAGVFNPLIILPAQLLSEADEEALLSAIGHELVHVARQDYVLNLVYELIYLPLSFHPAAAVLRRRIKQTRELCCDELVAKKLLAPEVYARSLLRLVGSVPRASRLAPDTTMGITDADILEVRIMSLFKTSELSTRRKRLLLIASSLLLAAPCVAAAAFAVQLDIDNPEGSISQQWQPGRDAAQKPELSRRELERKERELVEVERGIKTSNPRGAELEALRRMASELRDASVHLSSEQGAQRLKVTDQGLQQLQQRWNQLITTYPAEDAKLRERIEKLGQPPRWPPENEEWSRKLLNVSFSNILVCPPCEPPLASIPKSAKRSLTSTGIVGLMAEQSVSLRRARAELDQRQEEIRKDMDKRRKELDETARAVLVDEQSELTQVATISMDRAIQIAVSQYPGKVLACSLRLQTDGQAFYRLVIVIKERDKSSAKRIWMSATDGRILKTHDE
jgi:uncharacterized membrane protein YkoI